jgi:hypothetical protein
MPIHGRYDVVAKVGELRETAEAAGRDPDSISLGVFGAPPRASTIERYRDAGFTRAVLGLPQSGESEILGTLDEVAKLVGTFG